MNKNKKIALITGVTGQDGAYLVEFLLNKNYLEMVKKSAFSSQANEIVDDDFKLDKNQTISIIPPIGGG